MPREDDEMKRDDIHADAVRRTIAEIVDSPYVARSLSARIAIDGGAS